MNKSFLLGALGFLIGGSLVAYSELKTGFGRAPATAEAARQPEAGRQTPDIDDRPLTKTPSKQTARRSKRKTTQITGKNRRAGVKPRVRTKPRENTKPVQPPKKTRRKQAENPGVHSPKPAPAPHVRLNRVLVGEELVTAGILPASTLDEYGKHGKYLVYFDLSFGNPDQERARSVQPEDFRLEGTEGLIYTPLLPVGARSTDTHRGGSSRCGVVFALYNDSAPARLLYRTGKKTFTPLPESVFWRSR